MPIRSHMKLIILSLLIFLSACNAQLEQYVQDAVVKSVDPSPITNTEPEPEVSNSTHTYKVSPGHVLGTSTNMSIKANISPTTTSMASANTSVRISILRFRME